MDCKMTQYVCINGEIRSLEAAKISILDRGFLYGEAVAETLVAFDQQILSLPEHLERLELSAKRKDIGVRWTKEQLTFEINSLIETIPAKKKYLRIIITSGEGFGLEHSGAPSNNRYIFAMPAPQQNPDIYIKGIHLGIFNQGYTNRESMAKTTQYSARTMAFRQSKQSGFDDCLHVNLDGEISEATSANIFFVERQGEHFQLVTPALKSGILNGITRARILKICKGFDVPFVEKVIPYSNLAKFDEAFLTSSVKGLVPVSKIDKHRLHTLRQDSFFRKIELIFIREIENQVGRKIDWNLG